jgi:adenylate cyclase
MGDAVNLASRLEGANKAYGSHCLVSAPTIAAAGDGLAFREIDRLVVVGQSQPETVFELIGREDELTPDQVSLLDSYSKGLAAYRERRWDDARHAFSAGLEAVPGDGPSRALVKRIGEFQANPPPADWDGAWRLDEK